MTQRLTTLLLGGALLLAATATGADQPPMRFLNHQGLAALLPEERADFAGELVAMLNRAAPQAQLQWVSSHSDSRIHYATGLPYQRLGATCRNVNLTPQPQGAASPTYRFEFCQRNGQWQLVTAGNDLLQPSDLTLLKQQLNQLLDDQSDGESRRWTNLETANQGSLRLLNSAMHEGQRCRLVEIRLDRDNAAPASGRYRFCRQPDGQWQLSRS